MQWLYAQACTHGHEHVFTVCWPPGHRVNPPLGQCAHGTVWEGH